MAQDDNTVKSKNEQEGKNDRVGYMVGKLNNKWNDVWCTMKYTDSSACSLV